jgi:hypothetical protein
MGFVIDKMRNYADQHGKKYLKKKHLKQMFPYDAATGWRMFNVAKMLWWNSELRKAK